jgi:uncharacterized membrane protein
MKVSPPPPRYPLPDLARGVAVMLMIAYHFCYDLVFFQFAQFDLQGHPFWLSSRALIVTLFVFMVGVSLRLAARSGSQPSRFLRRLAWLLLCAGLVTLGSWWLFPDRYIFFGVLHFIAVASVLGLALLRLDDRLKLALGIALIAIGNTLQHDFFNQPAWQWLGLMTHKPATEDYVSLLPWLGVMLCGLWAGRRGWEQVFKLPRWAVPMRWLGRHSLAVYMLHQPLLMGIFYLAVAPPGR